MDTSSNDILSDDTHGVMTMLMTVVGFLCLFLCGDVRQLSEIIGAIFIDVTESWICFLLFLYWEPFQMTKANGKNNPRFLIQK